MTKILWRILGMVTISVGLQGVTVQAAPANLPVPTQDELDRVAAALPAEAPAQPQKPRKILLFWRTEGYFHQCIPLANQALKMLGEKTGAYSVEISDDMAMFNPQNLERFDGILFNSTTDLKFDAEQEAALLGFVRGGKGIMGIHAATDNFRCCEDAATMIGGMFDGHPWTAGGTWAVKVDEPDHPLNHGFPEPKFQIKDEIYQIKGDYSRANQRVLLSMDMDAEQNWQIDRNGVHRPDKDFGITWIKRYGEGRVFYCSLGHNTEIFWNKDILQHYLAGFQYALGDLAVDDAPSSP